MKMISEMIVLPLAAVLIGAVPSHADRQAVPTTQEIEQAQQTIQDTYKDKLAKPAETDRIALANELFVEAGHNVNDPASQYALLIKARDLAASAGDLELGNKICSEITGSFDISLGSEQALMFSQAARAMFSADDYYTYVAADLRAADDSLKEDDFASARVLLKLAATYVSKSGNSRLAEKTRDRQLAAVAQERQFKTVQPQMIALAAHPDDPKLNTIVGSYICFSDGDWDRGLPLLVKGNDARLSAAANMDLLAPTEPEQQAAIGDGWYMLAETFDKYQKLRIDMRAYDWMQKAMPHLTGLRAAQTQSRLKSLDTVIAQYSEWGEIWLAVRAAIRQHTAVETEVMAGAFGKQSYQEVPAVGAVLVGFHLGLGKFVSNDTITQIQAVYQTQRGMGTGKIHGASTGPFLNVIARNGYAVGAIDIHGGGGLDSITITFMKITGNKLDPTQSYESDRIGGTAGSSKIVDGEGVPIIGIVGKLDVHDKAAGLGVVFAAAPAVNDTESGSHRKSTKTLVFSPLP